MSQAQTICVVSWPGAPLKESLILKSLKTLRAPLTITNCRPSSNNITDQLMIQWSSYDEIDHELVHSNRQNTLSSSYTFRKALIRKHFLSRCIHSYVTKYPTTALKAATPKTFEIEISFVDELDELWADDLWDLGEELENSRSWWILKPGMADRGMGIRLFNSKEALQQIFEEFEADSDHSDVEGHDGGTGVIMSQLRHFVVQAYISNPLLLDPADVTINGSSRPINPQGHKFHLRAFCVCLGALEVYLYDRVLALFSAVPYVEPGGNTGPSMMDLAPHLTNTSLQISRGEEGVRLLDELVGCRVLSSGQGATEFTQGDIVSVIRQMGNVLAETFRAALRNPVHFQPLPNAFELYGVDFLIAHDTSGMPGASPYRVNLLEINAEPAIELTGPRLHWTLEDLFESISKVCIEPFMTGKPNIGKDAVWEQGRTHMIQCLREEVRA